MRNINNEALVVKLTFSTLFRVPTRGPMPVTEVTSVPLLCDNCDESGLNDGMASTAPR